MEVESNSDVILSRVERWKRTAKECAKTRLPILRWLPKYKIRYLVSDAVAGTTVFLTAIPQSMAYAGIAGLTPEFGLYSSFIPPFVYVFLGSCTQMTIGPTALVELLVYETCGQDFSTCVILIGFYMGIFQLLMGLLRVGVIVSLISEPVAVGFTSGAALTIMSAQVRNFLGLKGPKGSGFIGTWKENLENFSTIQLGDSLVGVCSVIVLVILKNLKDYIKPRDSKAGHFLKKALWLLSISRNAIIILAGAITAVSWATFPPPFQLTGSVKSGLPPVGVPKFTFPYYNNATGVQGTLTFWETWGKLQSAPVSVAFVSILQNVAIAKAFGSGQSIDATQEMFALGTSHIVASFFSAIPTSGSFTRSAVNDASGVKSSFSGIFTGILILFALAFLTPTFYYIPKASLAAVILCAVFSMIEYEALPKMWRVSKRDFLACMITFISALIFGMEFGIFIGLAGSVLLYLMKPMKPNMKIQLFTEEDPITYLIISPEQGLSFPGVDHVRTFVNKTILQYETFNVFAIDLRNLHSLDYTGANALRSLVIGVRKTGKHLIFINCINEDEWTRIFNHVGMSEPPFYKDISGLSEFVKDLKEQQLQLRDSGSDNPQPEKLKLLPNDNSQTDNQVE